MAPDTGAVDTANPLPSSSAIAQNMARRDLVDIGFLPSDPRTCYAVLDSRVMMPEHPPSCLDNRGHCFAAAHLPVTSGGQAARASSGFGASATLRRGHANLTILATTLANCLGSGPVL